MVEDAVYAAADHKPEKLASDWQIAKARRIVRRFLSELPGELTVADMRGQLEESE